MKNSNSSLIRTYIRLLEKFSSAILSLESNSRLLWFCNTTWCDYYVIGSQNSRHFVNQWESKPKPMVTYSHTHFPALDGYYMHLLRILIATLCSLRLLWLSEVNSLILVFTMLTWKLSKRQIMENLVVAWKKIANVSFSINFKTIWCKSSVGRRR